jgi:hypothetical protein
VANTLAFYDTATITAVKSFIVQASGDKSTMKCYHFIATLLTVLLLYSIDKRIYNPQNFYFEFKMLNNFVTDLIINDSGLTL